MSCPAPPPSKCRRFLCRSSSGSFGLATWSAALQEAAAKPEPESQPQPWIRSGKALFKYFSNRSTSKRKSDGIRATMCFVFYFQFRNQYDNDVTVWSPQGRIHQIEYAMEAVKQGSATVGLKSKTHAVLVALKRAQSELAAHQKKILHVDNHIGISIAGLTADARLLCNFMRQECLDSRFVFDRPLPVSRLVSLIGSKTQIPTQRYGRRPYGVGLLIAGYDDMGPHIFQTCPSVNYFDCRAMSIGARSQSARTYLERHMSEFMECNLNELVKHGLRALRETLPAEQDLTTKNVSIGIVGKDLEFTIYDDDDVSPFLEGLEERPQRKAQPAQPSDEPAEKADEPMEH
ncbi:PREDICTED: proteasome subunit alpha type-1 [Chrysochloris asiatica]|uniref:Proteasome subunit alpha type-1 n=1 Tax=Chrysochloris asiatica TaxID=185453 RepID=A0A9B0TNQ8_CHRAS|nr:PREDICTED: proteasome subunit alpha type-1 [Chrysochloris asiatica]